MAATAMFTRSEIVGKEFCHVYTGSDNTRKRPRLKTVTWPIDEKICEVRQFLIDDAPSSLRVPVWEFSHHQQGNPMSYNEAHFSSSSHVMGAKRGRRTEQGSILPDVPPGFSSFSTASKALLLKDSDAMAVTVSWHVPRKFFVDASWLWAEGEESVEVASQQERERRAFEAFYPRLASIPDSPLEPSESSKEIDDALVAQIPLVPTEEEEMEDEDLEQQSNSTEKGIAVLCMSEHKKTVGSIMASNDSSDNVPTKHDGAMSIADANIAAAAAAACMAVKALGENDLVDEALLFELLKNPSLLKSLTRCSSYTKDTSQNRDSGIISTPTAHQEPLIHKLPSEHGSCLDRSPVSVLAQWGDSVSVNNPLRAFTSTHMQKTPNRSSMSMNSSIGISTSYPCSNPELHHRNPVQEGFKCTPRSHKQIHETSTINAFGHSIAEEASLLHNYKSGEGMRSQPNSGKASQTRSMLEVMTISPFSVHSTTKELSQRNSLQVEPHLSAENSSFPRRTGAFSMSCKTGGRAKRLCMYYNTPRGCRNGDSCAFVHQ